MGTGEGHQQFRWTDEDLRERFDEYKEEFEHESAAIRAAIRDGMETDADTAETGFREGAVDGLFAGTITVCLLLLGQAALVWGVLPAVGIGLGGVAAFSAGILIPIRELA